MCEKYLYGSEGGAGHARPYPYTRHEEMFPFRFGAAGVARSASPTRSASAIARSLKRGRSLNKSLAKCSGLKISPN